MIHVLPDELISQIAAGEVIERPASALKELIENALDADSKRILVEIEQGGLRKLRVVDDGHGVRHSEAALAFTRHATSKISKIEDLFELHSLGFRGEALAAIASVSRVVLLSKHEDERVGTRVEIDGGKLIEHEEASHDQGTEVSIYGLFKHTPARKKYMKSERTEYGHCFELVSHTALAHPHVAFKLVRDGKTIFDLPKNQSLRDRVRSLYGADTAKNLLKVSYEQSNLRIYGFIGKPELSVRSRKYQFLFVNHRPIENRSISHAVTEACHSLLMHEKYPWFLLDIEVDPELVDVNVHPRKKEVKFVNQQEVYRAVMGAVHHALETNLLSPVLGNGQAMDGVSLPGSGIGGIGMLDPKFQAELQGTQAKLNSGARAFVPSYNQGDRTNFQRPSVHFPHGGGGKKLSGPIRSKSVDQGEHRALHAPVFQIQGSVIRPLAQLAKSYILGEGEEGLVLIDQHAAHERVRYAVLMDALNKEGIQKQALLLPAQIELGADGARLIEAHLEDFSAMGFEIEAFGGNSFILRSVPVGLEHRDPEQVLGDILGDLEREGFKVNADSNAGKDLREHLLTYTACRSAVKFGDSLTLPEMEALLKQMEETKHCTHCPHGRPAVITFTYNKLETLFKRRNF